jgi:hypothetical protein
VEAKEARRNDLNPAEVTRRLMALDAALTRFPAGLVCPWPLARVFNELLRRSKELMPDDPILKGIRFVKERESDVDEGGSDALIGTVLGLAGQVAIALEAQDTATRGSVPAGEDAVT